MLLALPMPVLHYKPCSSPCRLCGEGFDHTHLSPGEADLTACPTCGQPVTRESIARFNSPKLLRPASVSDAKAAGFTVLRRTGHGEFEKQ